MANKAQAPTQTPQEQLAAKQAELIETRRSHAAGELVNPRALGRIRKEIARIQTTIHTQMNAPAPVKETKEAEEKK